MLANFDEEQANAYLYMNPELITRLVKLVEKTGDRVILPDLESGKAVVVMDLDAYERICTPDAVASVAASTPSVAQRPEPAPQAPPAFFRDAVDAIASPAPARAATSDRPEGRNKAENKAKTQDLGDLTQEELLDRINRDIDDWKTAQDAKRTHALQSAARDLPELSEISQLEEEERFFLEPIE